MAKKRLSICIAATGMTIPPTRGGGIEAVTYEMAKKLCGMGHKVSVLTTDGRAFSSDYQDNVNYVECKMRELPFMLTKVAGKTDVIHAIERSNSFLSLPFMAITPVIYHIHNQYPTISTERKPLRKYFVDRVVAELGMRLSTHVLSCKEEAKTHLVKTGVSARKITVLENAVDSEYFSPLRNRKFVRETLGLTNDEKVILFVGRIDPSKGLEETIRALPLVKEKTKLLIAGPIWNRDYYNNVQLLIRSLGLKEKVLFLGNVSYFELRKFYGVADLYICLANAISLPTTLLQAMAMELPVIVPNSRPYTQIVTPQNGHFVENPKNPQSVAAVINLLLKDQVMAKKIAYNARQFILDNFSWAAYCDRLVCLYEKILGYRDF